MLPDDIRKKLQNIVRGVVIEAASDSCATIRNYLCERFSTSKTVKKNFEDQLIVKEKQAELIRQYISDNDLWVSFPLPGSRYLTRGGEAQVYLDTDQKRVIKLNDAVYYATWLEFFNSLVIHNLIFSNTSYTLIGFAEVGNTLYAVLSQSFVKTDELVDLADVKELLAFNGFQNTKRNDYRNEELGLILEDMHDENILVISDVLFFIDTVFYIDVGDRSV